MKKQFPAALIGGIGFVVLILDTKIALQGASDGIRLCIQTVVPSLFPFLFLSTLLTSGLSGQNYSLLKPLCRLLHIPQGAQYILLLGLVGGYPVGAKCIAEAARAETISRENARRMLAFCSNAGPAFLFGISSNLFANVWYSWALWGIHIASALMVGSLIPGSRYAATQKSDNPSCSMTQALQRAIRVMGTICGWVILFRVVYIFCQRWFLWIFPTWLQCIFAGLLELTNGCCLLIQIPDPGLRFVLCALFLGFGGLCITMQTYSVCDGVDASLYLPGKCMQALLSTLMASAIISREMALLSACVLVTIMISAIVLRKKRKKDGILAAAIV